MAIANLQAMALGLIILVITISVGAKVLTTVQGTQTSNAADYNITGKGITAIGTYADFFSVIVVISVLAAIILLFGMVGGRRE